MNIFAPFIQPLARAIVTACYARALRDLAEAAERLDGIGQMVVSLNPLMVEDIKACSPPQMHPQQTT